MEPRNNSSIFVYLFLILASLFSIFFVWREFNGETNTEDLVITSDGINHFAQWMDIAWWVSLTYKIDFDKYKKIYTDEAQYFQVTKDIENIILQKIDQRISTLWVSDYSSNVQTLDDGKYVVVEIWWVSDLDQAKEIIGTTVELEFKTLFEGDLAAEKERRQLFAESILKQAIWNEDTMQSLGQKYKAENIVYQSHSNQPLSNLPIFYQENADLLKVDRAGTILSVLWEWTYWAGTIFVDWIEIPQTVEWYVITKLNKVNWSGETATYDIESLVVDYRPGWVPATDPQTGDLLNWAYFKFAQVSATQTGLPAAAINFDETGKKIFCHLTEEIVGKQMAIFIWWELVTSPVIRQKICWGTAQIDGNFTNESARELVDELNNGAFPAPLILAQEEKVSPVLWEKAMSWALLAAAIGLALIYVFMMYMYWFKQWSVAILTLLWFIIVLLWITKLFKYAFSLSWIAAILLSLGMWVDANVLIYERIREERANWLPWLDAIKEWYDKSYSAIRDWNVTTLMIALLLFFVWTNVFKWFGTMMMVNILLTLWVIVPLTKILLNAFYANEE